MATKTTKGRLAKYPSTSITVELLSLGGAVVATYTPTTGTKGQFSIDVTEALTGWFDVLAYVSGAVRGQGNVKYESDTAGTYYVDDPAVAASGNVTIEDSST